MRKIICFIFLIVIGGMLSGCCLSHEWVDATCTEPKHCVKCGKKEGLSLLHDYAKATCTKPQTCIMCGATTGEPLGHTWVERTIGVPKTCSVCGETEGEPIYMEELKFKDLPSDKVYHPMLFISDRLITRLIDETIIVYYDYNGKEVNRVDLGQYIKDNMLITYNTMPSYDSYKKNDILLYFISVDENKICSVYLFDGHGEKFFECHEELDIAEIDYIDLYDIADNRYLKFGFLEEDEDKDEKPLLCIDTDNMSLVDPNSGSSVGVLHTYKKFKNVSTCENNDKYLIARKTDGKTLYINIRYQYTEGEFYDASGFSVSGFSLASPDGKSYDLLDSDLNVVAKDVLRGSSASWRGDNVFGIRDDQGLIHYYRIK